MEKIGFNTTADEVRELDRQGLIERKLKRAPLKDTVTVPDGGYTIVRFYADNPGKTSQWHSHIKTKEIKNKNKKNEASICASK